MICARPGCNTVFCSDRDYAPGKDEQKLYCCATCKRRASPSFRLVKLRQQEKRAGADAPLCRKRAKIPYPDEAAAAADITARSLAYGVPLRAYQCPFPECGSWHLTSQPVDGYEAVPAADLGDLVRELARKVNTRP
jgi:hypothetical protein